MSGSNGNDNFQRLNGRVEAMEPALVFVLGMIAGAMR